MTARGRPGRRKSDELTVAANGRGGFISLGNVHRNAEGRRVRVTYLFQTTEGAYAALRDLETDSPLGNVPVSTLEPHDNEGSDQ